MSTWVSNDNCATHHIILCVLMQGPWNIIFIGVLKTLERSERSINWPGVQGPAVGPLVGSRGNAPGGGPGPGGFTLHMIGYAPACTKSVEKGSFLDIRRRRRLLQKGHIFRC